MRKMLIALLAGMAMTLPAMAMQSEVHHHGIHHARHHMGFMHRPSRPYTNPANATGHT